MPEYRKIDGTNNNQTEKKWGSAGQTLLRLVKPQAYADGISKPRQGPNARAISNAVCRVEIPRQSGTGLSDFMWAWGQFLDHELDLTPEQSGEEGEEMKVEIGAGDPFFAAGELSLHRSKFADGTGKNGEPAEQINDITAFIDASNVYSSDKDKAADLRSGKGGKLRTGQKNLLPLDSANPNPVQKKFFLAGDARASENSMLISMHTLFMREHNRRCDQIANAKKGLSDEAIYQRARRYVGALMQVITYKEFLPALLGDLAPGTHSSYDPDINPGISNIFATVGYRLGHSMLSEHLRMENEKREVALAEAFFTGGVELVKKNGIEPFLAGAMRQRMREIDTTIVESVRSFLFTREDSPPTLFDLAARNIMRGRDHGIPGYNECREDMHRQLHRLGVPATVLGKLKLAPKMDFWDIAHGSDIGKKLASVYNDVDEIDPWVGMLAENHVEGANVGELTAAILIDQFTRLRDGDRFWYSRDPDLRAELAETGENLARLENRRLSDVIRDNTEITIAHGNIFYAAP